MPIATVTKKVSIGGVVFSGTSTINVPGLILQEVTLPAGKAGAISASGVDGLETEHGITDADTVDVHWTDADGERKCRYGIAVDTASANAITFDDDPAAAGDALPEEDTPVVVSVQTVIDMDFNAANASLFAAHCNQAAHLACTNDDPVTMLGIKLAADYLWEWQIGEGADNPFTAETDDVMDSVKASNGGTSAALLKIGVMYNSLS